MKKYLATLATYILPLLLFFAIETLFHGNEIIPFIFVCFYVAWLYYSACNKKAEAILFLTGGTIGLIIELGMTLLSRAQVWQNTAFLSVPLWLPLAWGVAAVIFYRFGKKME